MATDDLRAVVGRDRHDLRATKDAMEVLELIVTKRLARGLTDGHRLDRARPGGARPASAAWPRAARVPCHAVAVDTPEREARARNRGRPEAVPSAVVTSQLRSFAATLDALGAEGFDGVHRASDGDVELVPRPLYDAPDAARRQEEEPMPMRFGLQIGRFDVAGRGRRAGAAPRRPSPAPPRTPGSPRSR